MRRGDPVIRESAGRRHALAPALTRLPPYSSIMLISIRELHTSYE